MGVGTPFWNSALGVDATAVLVLFGVFVAIVSVVVEYVASEGNGVVDEINLNDFYTTGKPKCA